MNNVVLKLIFSFVCGAILGLLVLYGIDRECARRDYEIGVEADDCIFKSNCKFYNDQMKGDFFRG